MQDRINCARTGLDGIQAKRLASIDSYTYMAISIVLFIAISQTYHHHRRAPVNNSRQSTFACARARAYVLNAFMPIAAALCHLIQMDAFSYRNDRCDFSTQTTFIQCVTEIWQYLVRFNRRMEVHCMRKYVAYAEMSYARSTYESILYVSFAHTYAMCRYSILPMK